MTAATVTIKRKTRWSALAAGAALESALAEIGALLGRIEPENAERELAGFQREFEGAFKRKSTKACRVLCARYVGRFKALAEEQVE